MSPAGAPWSAGGGLGLRHRRVQRVRRLLARSELRAQEGAFVVEGPKLATEALSSGARVEGLYVAEGYTHPVVELAVASGVRVFPLAPGVLERVATTATPQPVLAVVRASAVALDDLAGPDRSALALVVVCVDLRDPGNLGTVLRTAEAAGAEGVICCEGTVDVHNPKCLRASAGSVFHVPVVTGVNATEALGWLGARGYRRVGTRALGGRDHHDLDFSRPTALVLGNEAHGLGSELSALIDVDATIAIRGRSESLNVGMAAAVLCFEVASQQASP